MYRNEDMIDHAVGGRNSNLISGQKSEDCSKAKKIRECVEIRLRSQLSLHDMHIARDEICSQSQSLIGATGQFESISNCDLRA